MKMLSLRLAMPLLGILLWVISTHAGTFAGASFLPSMPTGTSRTYTILKIKSNTLCLTQFQNYLLSN